MNNNEVINLLKTDIPSWNRWRKEDPRLINLSGIDLSGIDLSEANLSEANLSEANLSNANLFWANLSEANLSKANLSEANLSEANLHKANLHKANLSEANLSGTNGLLKSIDWLNNNFEKSIDGFFVFKIESAYNKHPASWLFEANKVITEVPNQNRTDLCGCGVNFATLDWCKNEFSDWRERGIWKCLLTWEALADVCVPYNTDGKARCASLVLLEDITDTL